MSVETESRLPDQKVQENTTPEPALTQAELDAAEHVNRALATAEKGKKAIYPVPENAPAFNYRMKQWGGTPDRADAYHDKDGNLLLYMCRWNAERTDTGQKEYRPVSYCEFADGGRGWAQKGHPDPRPLYRLHEILRNPEKWILVNEGEKSAEAGQVLFPNWVSTSPMHGAKSPHKTDWSTVKDRVVVIAGDVDDAGKSFAGKVCHCCKKAGAKAILRLHLEEYGKTVFSDGKPEKRALDAIPKGYDLDDVLQEGWTPKR